MRTAIIGGGIAGLAAAYELEKARAAGVAVEYAVYEARDRLGGVMASEVVNGAVLERGPDSFLTEKPAAADRFKRCSAQDLHPGQKQTHSAARRTNVPGAYQADSNGTYTAVLARH
jgi:protoporphyrinogen oxidase